MRNIFQTSPSARGSFRPVSPVPVPYLLILRRRGVELDGPDYVRLALNSVSEASRSGYRTVVVTDIFEGWPESDSTLSPDEYVDCILTLRKQTK
jgi:hypothetical protein